MTWWKKTLKVDNNAQACVHDSSPMFPGPDFSDPWSASFEPTLHEIKQHHQCLRAWTSTLLHWLPWIQKNMFASFLLALKFMPHIPMKHCNPLCFQLQAPVWPPFHCRGLQLLAPIAPSTHCMNCHESNYKKTTIENTSWLSSHAL